MTRKSLLVIAVILTISIFVTSCSEKKEKAVEEIPTAQNSNSVDLTNEKTAEDNTNNNAEKTSNDTETKPTLKNIEDISAKDFVVTDGKSDIILDSPYKDFKVSQEEEKQDNNYVGETTSGDATYKNYMHEFDDFDIYVSNAYYDTKKRNFDDYYITQINLKTPAYKTKRGVKVGASLSDVIKLYGEGKKIQSDEMVEQVYRLGDRQLSFVIGKDDKVQEIGLNIVVE